MKHIIATLVIIAIAVFLFREMYQSNYETTQQHCGKITYKGSYDQMHKYSSHHTFIFVVDIDGKGKQDYDVSASTWTSYEVGDRICFNPLRNKIELIGIALLMTSGAVIVCCLIWFVINMKDFIHD